MHIRNIRDQSKHSMKTEKINSKADPQNIQQYAANILTQTKPALLSGKQQRINSYWDSNQQPNDNINTNTIHQQHVQ